jgi:hypothetical protein
MLYSLYLVEIISYFSNHKTTAVFPRSETMIKNVKKLKIK